MKGRSRVSRTDFDREPGYENSGASSNLVHGSRGSSYKETFSDIAFSRDHGANGFAYQYDARSGTEARTLQECSAFTSDFTNATCFGNACVRLTVVDGSGWG